MSRRLPVVVLVVTAFLAALIVLINTSGGGVATPPAHFGGTGIGSVSTSSSAVFNNNKNNNGTEEDDVLGEEGIVMNEKNNTMRKRKNTLHKVKYTQDESKGLHGTSVRTGGEDLRSSDSPIESGSASLETKESAKRVGFPISKLKQVVSVNSERCKNGQPLTSPIQPYAKCPLPGLNNILYTQINRWYCAYRDGNDIELRDRSCTKKGAAGGRTIEAFRFSSFLTVRYEEGGRGDGGDRVGDKMAIAAYGARDGSSKRPISASHWGGGGTNASICWSDIPGNKQTIPARCEWRDIPSFYGTKAWWQARAMIDFHEQYYHVAAHYVHKIFPHLARAAELPEGHERFVSAPPFVAVHVRRGDYFTHCHHVKNQRIPVWISFKHTPHLVQDPAGRCFPNDDQMINAISNVAAKLHFAKQTARDKGGYSSRVPEDSIEQNGNEKLGITTAQGVVNVLVATNHPHELKDLQRKISGLKFAVTQQKRSSFSDELLEIGAEKVNGNSAAALAVANNGNSHDGGAQSNLFFSINLVLFDDKRLSEIQNEETGGENGYKIRDVDRTIVEMTMLSMGSYFIFNAHSSFSGTIFEQATLHGRVSRGGNVTNVFVW